MASGTFSLRPKARVIRALGSELISSDAVAVTELVKNAYDADATRVSVRFSPSSEGKGQVLEVVDDGTGMSLETITSQWAAPSDGNKRQHRISPRFGRRVLGEKGIGRFAASRLSDNLTLVSRERGSDRETTVRVNWADFDSEDAYLEDINLAWTEGAPEYFAEGCGKASGILGIASDHGTALIMAPARSAWTRDDLERLSADLSRMTLPKAYGPSNQVDRFDITLSAPGMTQPGTALEPLGASWVLDHPHYEAKAVFDGAGELSIETVIKGRNMGRALVHKVRVPKDAGRDYACGALRIELKAWDRDKDALMHGARPGSTLTSLRRDLNAAAGITVYRDGFRVLPYGEPHYDWLGLDSRRVQNPTVRLSNNQVVGYVLLTADANPKLSDQTNREGLVEGPALEDLRKVVKLAIGHLEAERSKLRVPPKTSETTRRPRGVVSRLESIGDYLKKHYASDDTLKRTIAGSLKSAKSEIGGLNEKLAQYQSLALLGQLLDVVVHDINTPLGKLVSLAQSTETAAADNDLTRVGRNAGRMAQLAQDVALIVNRIAPLGGRKKGRPSKRVLEDEVAIAFDILRDEIEALGVEVTLPSTRTMVTADPGEVREVLLNLLRNSLYWLRRVDAERAIEVGVQRLQDSAVEIIFSDSGPGIDDEDLDHVFELYFSRSEDGVGLGLAIVKDIVTSFYGGSVEVTDEGPLPGATFRLILRKRV